MRYGKIHPKTGHEVQGVWHIYSSTLSLTSAFDRNGWSSRLEEGMRQTKNIDVNVRIQERILNKLDIRGWTEFNRFMNNCLKGMGISRVVEGMSAS
jgi:hypothetical protein